MRSGNPQSGLARRWQQVCADGLWNLAVLGLFSLLYFTIRYRLELQEQKEKTLRATALAHQAQLQMLRYQLNPHFLFNALNSIRAMILEDAGKSRKMVTTLSEFLRYSLDGDTKETTIGGEVAAIRNYLEIQRIRFERKLEVTTEIDPEAESAAIPCFLVHPLVENAVKHGMNTSAMPLRVKIQVSRFADQLRIRVLNTGRLASGDSPVGDATDGTGTGLRNIAQRLELVFPGRHSFSIRESEGWVHAEIDVALEPRVEHETVSSLDRG
jgi:LytS/YehU family sensor histidine kinase